jgi:hypothetical protein
VGRHIVALEVDKELFSTLFASMVRFPVVSFSPQPQFVQHSQDLDAMEIVLTKIKKRRASK